MNLPEPFAPRPLPAPCRVAAVACGAFAGGGGLVSLLGWVLDVPRMASWAGGPIAIQPNAALCALLVGTGLVVAAAGRLRAARWLGIGAAGIAIATLFEHLTGTTLGGFDTWLTFGQDWGFAATRAPGRMGPPASASWTLLGGSLALLAGRAACRRAAVVAAVAVSGLTSLSLVGYLFGADMLYAVPTLTAIALQTATVIWVAAVGLVACVPEQDPVRTVLDDGIAGHLARETLPLITVLPIALGWARLQAQRVGLIDTAMGTALYALALIALASAVLWRAIGAASSRERALLAAQREVREADRRKDEFLATLAHELRNPLAPLRNALEILKAAPGDAGTAERMRVMMERQLGHLVRLVDDLLDVSRVSRGKVTLRPERLELARAVEQALEATRTLAADARVTVRPTLPAAPLAVEADAARVTQMVANLLTNACKFTPPGGTVEVAVAREGETAVVRVTDSGVGIPPEMLERIFDMFAQVHQPLEREHGGLGIGLTLVRQLAGLHGGTVSASSDGPGRGSTFTLRLPAAPPAPAATAEPPRDAAAPAAGLRVLVVDDNTDAVASLAELLRGSGVAVDVAYDGDEAVAQAARGCHQVVLLDIGLPRLNGYEACRRIRGQAGRRVLIVAMTGWGQAEDRRRSEEAGFDHHLVKPVDPQALLHLIGQVARRPPATTGSPAP